MKSDIGLLDTLSFLLERVGRMPYKEPDHFKDEPGDLIPGQGIFLGRWRPKDDYGDSLGKTFNVYAAPEDLVDDDGYNRALLDYERAVFRVFRLKNWHGHDGGLYRNAGEIYSALVDGKYKGEWFIPPLQLFTGRDKRGKIALSNTFRACKDKRAFKNTFNMQSSEESGGLSVFPGEYWSSDSYGDFGGRQYAAIDMKHNNMTLRSDDYPRCSCRPVRLVEIKSS